jgi:hypothetical protein
MNPIFVNTTAKSSDAIDVELRKPRKFTKAPIRDIKNSMSRLQKFWSENMAMMKDHLPIPPRRGLIWDPVKHRWTRPEKAGLTVVQVSGKKRIRGTGTGAAQGAVQRKRGLERFISQRRGREASPRRGAAGVSREVRG